MTNNNNPPSTLLPHQQALVDEFFNNSTKRGFVAQWDPGLGSTLAIAHIVKNFVAGNPSSRVLVLSPKLLAEQTHYRLIAVGLNADLIDRFRFRIMQDQVSIAEPIWHDGGIYVLGTDFAKQDDVADGLCSVEWNLLIIHEAYLIRGQKDRLVTRLVQSSPACRVLLQTLPGVDNLPNLGIEQWVKSTVRHHEVVDATGRRIFDLPAPILRSIEFQLDASESRLQDAVAEVVKVLDPNAPNFELFGTSLENAMQSSVSALEEVLHRLRNRLVHDSRDSFQGDEPPNDEIDADQIPRLQAADNEELLVALDKCLVEVESISGDSKLAALTHLLTKAKESENSSRSTCVITKYRATLSYIQTALDDLGFATFALHGSLKVGERIKVLEQFKNNKGILVATTALMKNIDMPDVDFLIMYDLPKDRLILQQILARFQRYGRSVPLKIDVINGQGGIDMVSDVFLKSVGGVNAEAIAINQ